MFRVKTKETEWREKAVRAESITRLRQKKREMQEEFKKALEDMKRGIFSYEY